MASRQYRAASDYPSQQQFLQEIDISRNSGQQIQRVLASNTKRQQTSADFSTQRRGQAKESSQCKCLLKPWTRSICSCVFMLVAQIKLSCCHRVDPQSKVSCCGTQCRLWHFPHCRSVLAVSTKDNRRIQRGDKQHVAKHRRHQVFGWISSFIEGKLQPLLIRKKETKLKFLFIVELFQYFGFGIIIQHSVWRIKGSGTGHW